MEAGTKGSRPKALFPLVRVLERIKLPRTIASKKFTPRKKVPHRKT
jgi:hypothetical protein